jgi:uncharacterized protein YndB with AHSA1/START domain
MLKKIGVAVAVLLAGVLTFAATKPDSFEVRRSLSMKAPPERVFALVEDFHQWPTWSPWERLDPGMQRTHSGAPKGKGAVYAWRGNDQVGRGRMEILDASAPSRVTIQLEFFEPWEARNTAEFIVVPSTGGTTVTWSMRGPSPFMSKLMSVFMDLDQMIGKDFEAGLANMRTAAERGAP